MQKSFIAQDIECFLSMFNQSQIPLHTKYVMLIVKGTHEGRTHDIHYLLPHKNLFYMCVTTKVHVGLSLACIKLHLSCTIYAYT